MFKYSLGEKRMYKLNFEVCDLNNQKDGVIITEIEKIVRKVSMYVYLGIELVLRISNWSAFIHRNGFEYRSFKIQKKE